MKRISNIFICLLIALTTNVLSINASIAEEDSTAINAANTEVPEFVEAAQPFDKDSVYTKDPLAQTDTEETKLN